MVETQKKEQRKESEAIMAEKYEKILEDKLSQFSEEMCRMIAESHGKLEKQIGEIFGMLKIISGKGKGQSSEVPSTVTEKQRSMKSRFEEDVQDQEIGSKHQHRSSNPGSISLIDEDRGKIEEIRLHIKKPKVVLASIFCTIRDGPLGAITILEDTVSLQTDYLSVAHQSDQSHGGDQELTSFQVGTVVSKWEEMLETDSSKLQADAKKIQTKSCSEVKRDFKNLMQKFRVVNWKVILNGILLSLTKGSMITKMMKQKEEEREGTKTGGCNNFPQKLTTGSDTG